MWLLERIADTFRWIGSYALGRGLLWTAVIAAGVIASATGFGIIVPAIVAGGGVVFNAFMAFREQGIFENQMIRLYRNELAANFGVHPNAVTRSHLYAMGKENSVIGDALAARQRKTIFDSFTGAIAGAVTFGLLYAGLALGVADFFTQHLGHVLGGALSVFSIGIVAGATNLTLNDGVMYGIGRRSGLTKAIAHEHVARLDGMVRRGHRVTPAQMLDVVVAINPEIDRNIQKQFGKSYHHMHAHERQQVVAASGLMAEMETMAQAVNTRTIRPSSLAFILDRKFISRAAEAAVTAMEEDVTPARKSFVERYASRAPESRSHVERLAAENPSTGRNV